MATKKKTPRTRAAKPAAEAPTDSAPMGSPELPTSVQLPHGNGPCLVGRDLETGELTHATDDSDALEFVVGEEVVHRGCEWLAPEHYRGKVVCIKRPA